MIHPTAVIDPAAQIAPNVQIGPYAVIGPDVTLQDSVVVGAHSVIEGHTLIGPHTWVSNFTAIGQPPQDVHYAGEPTRVEIGSHCAIREFVTIHRGTQQGGGITKVGDHCIIMAYAHVAHDCQVGNHVVMANSATLAGHVEIHDYAVIGGLTAIHQFARIGRNAFIGGASAISLDVIPFASAAGNRASITGVNIVGLRRNGFSEETIRHIRKAHRLIFRSGLLLEQAIVKMQQEFPAEDAVQQITGFIQNSQRGICR